MIGSPLVSIIVPTRNSDKFLNIVLKKIKNQTYKNIEIIVVDNFSNDKTLDIAKKYTRKIYSKGPERSAQRNYGSKQAKGKYLLFLDSDCELDKRLVKECVDLCEKGYDGIMIPLEHKTSSYIGMSKKLERESYIGDDDLESPWFIKNNLFKKIKGYDESLTAAEDWDLAYRLRKAGARLGRNKARMYHNLGKLNFWEEVKNKYYYGQTFTQYLNKRTANTKNQIPFFRKAYLKNWKLLLSHPFYTFGFMFLKFCESIAVLLGILSVKIFKIKPKRKK